MLMKLSILTWNINFIQGDILDKDLINHHCKDADIIHHLAGITKVPRVKSPGLRSKRDLE